MSESFRSFWKYIDAFYVNIKKGYAFSESMKQLDTKMLNLANCTAKVGAATFTNANLEACMRYNLRNPLGRPIKNFYREWYQTGQGVNALVALSDKLGVDPWSLLEKKA